VSEDIPDDVELMTISRSEESVISYLDKAPGQHMLEKPVDEFQSRESCPFPLISLGVFVAECDLIVFNAYNAVIGKGNAVNIGCQIFQSGGTIRKRFAVNHPVLFPEIRRNLFKEICFLERIPEHGPEDDRECFNGHKEVISGRYPLAVIRAKTSPWYDIVHMRVVAHITPPRMEPSHHTDLSADEPGISCQFFECPC
jgi:hypothetical protein